MAMADDYTSPDISWEELLNRLYPGNTNMDPRVMPREPDIAEAYYAAGQAAAPNAVPLDAIGRPKQRSLWKIGDKTIYDTFQDAPVKRQDVMAWKAAQQDKTLDVQRESLAKQLEIARFKALAEMGITERKEAGLNRRDENRWNTISDVEANKLNDQRRLQEAGIRAGAQKMPEAFGNSWATADPKKLEELKQRIQAWREMTGMTGLVPQSQPAGKQGATSARSATPVDAMPTEWNMPAMSGGEFTQDQIDALPFLGMVNSSIMVPSEGATRRSLREDINAETPSWNPKAERERMAREQVWSDAQMEAAPGADYYRGYLDPETHQRVGLPAAPVKGSVKEMANDQVMKDFDAQRQKAYRIYDRKMSGSTEPSAEWKANYDRGSASPSDIKANTAWADELQRRMSQGSPASNRSIDLPELLKALGFFKQLNPGYWAGKALRGDGYTE
jgi:hypothetical protein